MSKGVKGPALLGDIGATNARFALLDATGLIGSVKVTTCAQHPGLAEAAEAYLKGIGAHEEVRAAAIDVAGPVSGDRVALTNHPWGFSQNELRARLGLDHLLIVNDFAAAAPAATLYAPAAPIGVIGAGSGLGVGSILPVGEGRWIALAGEGGHVSLAPGTEREGRVWNAMRERFGHVSAERALSGPGLVNLYSFLSEID